MPVSTSILFFGTFQTSGPSCGFLALISFLSLLLRIKSPFGGFWMWKSLPSLRLFLSWESAPSPGHLGITLSWSAHESSLKPSVLPLECLLTWIILASATSFCAMGKCSLASNKVHLRVWTQRMLWWKSKGLWNRREVYPFLPPTSSIARILPCCLPCNLYPFHQIISISLLCEWDLGLLCFSSENLSCASEFGPLAHMLIIVPGFLELTGDRMPLWLEERYSGRFFFFLRH